MGLSESRFTKPLRSSKKAPWGGENLPKRLRGGGKIFNLGVPRRPFWGPEVVAKRKCGSEVSGTRAGRPRGRPRKLQETDFSSFGSPRRAVRASKIRRKSNKNVFGTGSFFGTLSDLHFRRFQSGFSLQIRYPKQRFPMPNGRQRKAPF